ncbi:hypothetical protein Ddc_06766 [Ditylenchus destructor]|nr:hypothetical protein Ddc_06766 [Ditylenchus destructor]
MQTRVAVGGSLQHKLDRIVSIAGGTGPNSISHDASTQKSSIIAKSHHFVGSPFARDVSDRRERASGEVSKDRQQQKHGSLVRTPAFDIEEDEQRFDFITSSIKTFCGNSIDTSETSDDWTMETPNLSPSSSPAPILHRDDFPESILERLELESSGSLHLTAKDQPAPKGPFSSATIVMPRSHESASMGSPFSSGSRLAGSSSTLSEYPSTPLTSSTQSSFDVVQMPPAQSQSGSGSRRCSSTVSSTVSSFHPSSSSSMQSSVANVCSPYIQPLPSILPPPLIRSMSTTQFTASSTPTSRKSSRRESMFTTKSSSVDAYGPTDERQQRINREIDFYCVLETAQEESSSLTSPLLLSPQLAQRHEPLPGPSTSKTRSISGGHSSENQRKLQLHGTENGAALSGGSPSQWATFSTPLHSSSHHSLFYMG